MKPAKKINGAPNVTIIPRPLKDGVTSYFLKYKDGDKWVKESCKDESGNVLHTIDKSAPFATEINRETKLQLQALRANKLLELTSTKERKTERLKVLSVADVCEIYVDYRKRNHYKSITSITAVCSRLCAFGGNDSFSKIDRAWVLAFQNYLNENMKQTSVSCFVAQLGSMLNWANGTYISFAQNPITLLKKDRVRTTTKNLVFLTADELKMVEGHESKSKSIMEVKRMFLAGCYCGLRWSDLNALTWGNIHKVDGQYYADVNIIKTSVPLHLPLNNKVLSLMGKRGAPSDKIFCQYTNKYCVDMVQSICKKLGFIKHITFHTSRHTFACLMLQRGVSLYAIKELMGHKRIETTMIYLTMMDEDKRRAVSVLDGL